MINEGGLHFSFLKNLDSIIKIKSYAHQEYNVSEFTDLNNIERKISKGLDLFNRDINIKKLKLMKPFQIILEKINKNSKNGFYNLVRLIGVEPITSGAEIRRSIQLKLPAQHLII